jgi:putative membrane protein
VLTGIATYGTFAPRIIFVERFEIALRDWRPARRRSGSANSADETRPRSPAAHNCAMYLLIRWLLNTLALFVVVELVPGFHYRTLVSLAIAALVLGLLNAIVRPILFVLTLPLTIVTLGLFLIVLNAIMLELTSFFAPGFRVDNFVAAIIGAIVLAIISWITNRIGKKPERR